MINNSNTTSTSSSTIMRGDERNYNEYLGNMDMMVRSTTPSPTGITGNSSSSNNNGRLGRPPRSPASVAPAPKRYYEPTLRRERTPSPPREYVYGVQRQREWHDAYPEQEEDDDDYQDDDEYDDRYQPYPQEEEDLYYPREQEQRHYHHDDHLLPRRYVEDHQPERYEQDRRWQEDEEEKERRRWEAEERYRRWEEEELRRYEEQNRRRREEQERRRHQEEVEEQERLWKEAKEARRKAAEAAKEKKKELMRPSAIPKPPPPHPGFEASHNPSHWALHRNALVSQNQSIPQDDEKTVKISGHSRSSRSVKLNTSQHSIDSWKPPYAFYSSNHSSEKPKPLHMCKTISSEDSHYYERKEVPQYLKKDSSHHTGMVGAFQEKTPSSHPEKGGFKKDSNSTLSSAAAYRPKPQPKPQPQQQQHQMTVEIQPGFALPLRGSQETLEAVATGHVLETPCLSCCSWIVVRDDCDFVICPECRVVSPVEGGIGTMQFVGLGMSRSVHDATVAKFCT